MTTDTTYRWPHKDLLDVTQLDAQDVRHLLNVAASFQEINLRPVKKVPQKWDSDVCQVVVSIE